MYVYMHMYAIGVYMYMCVIMMDNRHCNNSKLYEQRKTISSHTHAQLKATIYTIPHTESAWQYAT